MKSEIHPSYNQEATITCSCGATYTAGSTEGDMHVEVCSACHPFFTGAEKVLDTAGRVEKFKARREKAQQSSSKKQNTKRS